VTIETDEEWDNLQEAILRAVGDAERRNVDTEQAAINAVGDITTRDFAILVQDLRDRHLLNAQLVEVAESATPIDARVEGLTPAGRDQIRRSSRPSDQEYLAPTEQREVETFVRALTTVIDSGTFSDDDASVLEVQRNKLSDELRRTPRRQNVINILKVVAAVAAGIAGNILTPEVDKLLRLLGA
jgi:hypothetical protein